MNVLHNVLKAVGTTRSALTMKIDPAHPDAMQIKIWNNDTRTEAVNTLKLWCFSTDTLDISNSMFDFYVEMPSAYLQRHVNYLSTLMNNENNNKHIEVVVNSSGDFELAVEGEFGTTRLKIGSTEAGVKMHEGPANPMSEDFGMPKSDVVCDDEGDEGSGDEGDEEQDQQEDAEDEEESNANEDEEQDEEDYGGEKAPKKRKYKTKKPKAPKKPKKTKLNTANGKKKGFVPVPNRGSVLEEASKQVVQQRASVQRPPVRECFNIKYFKSIAKAASLSPTVLIFVREEFPIIFLYRIGTMGKLCFALSPVKVGSSAGAKDIQEDDEIDGGEIVDDAKNGDEGEQKAAEGGDEEEEK